MQTCRGSIGEHTPACCIDALARMYVRQNVHGLVVLFDFGSYTREEICLIHHIIGWGDEPHVYLLHRVMRGDWAARDWPLVLCVGH